MLTMKERVAQAAMVRWGRTPEAAEQIICQMKDWSEVDIGLPTYKKVYDLWLEMWIREDGARENPLFTELHPLIPQQGAKLR